MDLKSFPFFTYYYGYKNGGFQPDVLIISLFGLFLFFTLDYGYKESFSIVFHLIDKRRKDGRCPVFASCVTMSNLYCLSSSEAGVNPGIRSLKKALI
jgi:hypothetical protein